MTRILLVLAVAMMLSSCFEEGSESRSLDPPVAETLPSPVDNSPPYNEVRNVRLSGHPVLAGFAINPGIKGNSTQIFISPSCNFCLRMLFNTIRDVAQPNSPLRRYRIDFVMIPRKDNDLPIIAGLMCVPKAKRGAAIFSYYNSIYKRTADRAIENSVARFAYEETLRKFGVSKATQRSCEQNEEIKSLIAKTFSVVNNRRAQNHVPAVFVNNRFIPAQTFAEVRDQL